MKIYLILPFLFFLFSCSPDEGGGFAWPGNDDENEPMEENNGTWLVPQDEVFDGGPGKDGIPSIDAPVFVSPENINYLADEDLVIAVSFEDEIRVYPHPILDWHEIVNDEINGHYFALTYCPLTGTAINWNRTINGEVSQFGVSGLLYNSNLIPYDRKTGSNWSQMRLDCINGELQGKQIETYPVFETTWKTAKMLSGIRVMSTETGYSRDYGRYPYSDYRTNDDFLLFPISNEDNRLPAKERVLGIIGPERIKAYSFDDFLGDEEGLIFDVIGGRSVNVIGNKNMNFLNAYYLEDGRTYTLLRKQFPSILEDNLGNVYDVFGRVTNGPNFGERLSQPESYIGYWFSWATFYPDIELYQ